MKILFKLILLSIVFAVSILGIGFITTETFSRINKEIRESQDANLMIMDVFELNTLTNQYMIHHEKRMQQQWLQKYNSFGKLLDRMIRKESHSAHQAIFADLKTDYHTLGILFKRLQNNFTKRKSLIAENGSKVRIDMTFTLEERLITQALMRAQKIVSGAHEVFDTTQKSITTLQKRTNSIVLFSVIGVIVLSICVAFFAIKSITVPINKLVTGTKIVGAGNLEHKLGTASKDEIGQLSRAFDRMIDNLKSTMASRDELGKENAERKQAEKALRTSERFLSAIFDSIQDGISVLDNELNIIRVNQTMQDLYAHKLPLEGKRCYQVYHGRTKPCKICPTLRAAKTGKLEMDEVSLTQKDTVIGTLEVFAFPMFDDSGEVKGVVEFVRDITERKQAEEALHKAERLQGVIEMAGAVCHEMNQPLMAINGYSELISMNISSDDPLFENISKISEQSIRLGQITKKLMNITRYETKDYPEGNIIDIEKLS